MGSEAAWAPWILPFPGAPQTQVGTISYGAGLNWLKYLAFVTNPPQTFTLRDARFDEQTFNRVEELAPLHDATDPDLSAFRHAGGKLILWHGWADPAIPPFGTVAYYQAVQDAMGGLAATQGFARLFMFPGVNHCGGGQAPNTFDLLTPLLDWVESSTPPTRIVASQPASSAPGAPIIRTRPVFPYPTVARYDGSGSIDDAVNFIPSDPPQRFNDRIEWLGSFKRDDHLWCDWKDGNWVCSKNPG
jgi:feruloyl esterase